MARRGRTTTPKITRRRPGTVLTYTHGGKTGGNFYKRVIPSKVTKTAQQKIINNQHVGYGLGSRNRLRLTGKRRK